MHAPLERRGTATGPVKSPKPSRPAGNAPAAVRRPHRLADIATNPIQRVTIAGEAKTNGLIAQVNFDARFYEVKPLLDRYTTAGTTFASLDDLKTAVNALINVANGVIIAGAAVVVSARGGRANEHISQDTVVGYFRRYVTEIAAGNDQHLAVGEGREKTRLYGQILYEYAGGAIAYWHAHDKGKMG